MNGRAQIPMNIRKLLNITTGDRIIIKIVDGVHIVEENGALIDKNQ